jgi:ATP-dependent DNA helicase RecQ
MLGRAPARIVLPEDEPRIGRSAARVKGRGATGEAAREKRRDAIALDPETQAVFERLRAHRAEVARARRVPPYVVAFDRTLVELALHKPRSADALRAIHGFGPARIEQYGDGFLAVLHADS